MINPKLLSATLSSISRLLVSWGAQAEKAGVDAAKKAEKAAAQGDDIKMDEEEDLDPTVCAFTLARNMIPIPRGLCFTNSVSEQCSRTVRVGFLANCSLDF